MLIIAPPFGHVGFQPHLLLAAAQAAGGAARAIRVQIPLHKSFLREITKGGVVRERDSRPFESVFESIIGNVFRQCAGAMLENVRKHP